MAFKAAPLTENPVFDASLVESFDPSLEDLPDGYIEVNGRVYHFYNHPEDPAEKADLPALREVEGLRMMTDQDRDQHFDDLESGKKIIIIVEGMPLSDRSCSFFCDYCQCNIFAPSGWQYCGTCHRDMCRLCHWELLNGRGTEGSTSYEKRKDKIDGCRDHPLQRRQLPCEDQFSCNECGEEAGLPRYSNYEKEEWDCTDLCLNCAKTEEGKKLIEEEKLVLVNRPPHPWQQTDFGSLKDWAPLYQDQDGSMVLFNWNRQSPHFQKLALFQSDESKLICYKIESSLDQLLPELEQFHRLKLDLNHLEQEIMKQCEAEHPEYVRANPYLSKQKIKEALSKKIAEAGLEYFDSPIQHALNQRGIST
jgi:hypothetical protein